MGRSLKYSVTPGPFYILPYSIFASTLEQLNSEIVQVMFRQKGINIFLLQMGKTQDSKKLSTCKPKDSQTVKREPGLEPESL